MLCNFWKEINVWMMSELLRRVSRMMIISRKVDIDFIVELNGCVLVIGIIVEFVVMVIVGFVMFVIF